MYHEYQLLKQRKCTYYAVWKRVFSLIIRLAIDVGVKVCLFDIYSSISSCWWLLCWARLQLVCWASSSEIRYWCCYNLNHSCVCVSMCMCACMCACICVCVCVCVCAWWPSLLCQKAMIYRETMQDATEIYLLTAVTFEGECYLYTCWVKQIMYTDRVKIWIYVHLALDSTWPPVICYFVSRISTNQPSLHYST